MIDDSPRCRSIVSYPLYRLAVYLSPPPRYPKIHSPPKWPRQPLQITRLPCPVFPNIPLTVNFQFRNYRHRYEAPWIFNQGNVSPLPSLPVYTSYVLIRDDITRVACVYIYIWRVGGKNIRKKLRPRLWACIEWAKKPVEEGKERERNGGVKILKRVSWINSRECTRAKSHRSFPRPPYFPRATSRWIRNRCACSKMYRRPLLVENVKRGRLSKFLFFQNWW